MVSPLHLDQAKTKAFESVAAALGLEAWPPIPLGWNRRLRRAGRAIVEGRGRSFCCARIELSPAYFEVYPEDLYGIVVHEAVHVGLAIQERPFGHSPAFREACLRAGGQLHGRALPGRVFFYRCPICEATLERRRRNARDRWCAPCAEAAAGRGDADPFAPDRCLVLIGTAYAGPEARPDEPGGSSTSE